MVDVVKCERSNGVVRRKMFSIDYCVPTTRDDQLQHYNKLKKQTACTYLRNKYRTKQK